MQWGYSPIGVSQHTEGLTDNILDSEKILIFAKKIQIDRENLNTFYLKLQTFLQG